MWKKLGQIILLGAVNGAIGSIFDAATSGELTRTSKGGKRGAKRGEAKRVKPQKLPPKDPRDILYGV